MTLFFIILFYFYLYFFYLQGEVWPGHAFVIFLHIYISICYIYLYITLHMEMNVDFTTWVSMMWHFVLANTPAAFELFDEG